MVRIIAGTLYLAGIGKIGPDSVKWILESGERKNAGCTAPPQGLYLAEVYYSEAEMAMAAARHFVRQ
jgi:tRNA pseudouridine38-40 synthase